MSASDFTRQIEPGDIFEFEGKVYRCEPHDYTTCNFRCAFWVEDINEEGWFGVPGCRLNRHTKPWQMYCSGPLREDGRYARYKEFRP